MGENKIIERLHERFPYLICSDVGGEESFEALEGRDYFKSSLIADNLLRFIGNVLMADASRFSEEDEEIASYLRAIINDPGILQMLEFQEAFVKRRKRRALELFGLEDEDSLEISAAIRTFISILERWKKLIKKRSSHDAAAHQSMLNESPLHFELADFILNNFHSEMIRIESGHYQGYYLKSTKGDLLSLFPFIIGRETTWERLGLFESFTGKEAIFMETDKGQRFEVTRFDVLEGLAKFLLQLGLFQKSLDAFRIIRLHKDHSTFSNEIKVCESALMGFQLYQAGDFQGSVRELSRAIRLKSDQSQIYIQLSLAYMKLKETREAIDTLTKLLERNPTVKRAIELLGDFHMERGNIPEAKNRYEELLRMDPGNSHVQKKLEKIRLKVERRVAYKADEEAKSLHLPSRRIDEVMEDMLLQAQSGKYHPAVAREEELNRIIEILNCKTKNNPLLIGDPGVGKTAIVEGLALKMIKGEVPAKLARKKLYLLSVATLLAGTKYRGQFEEKVLELLKETKKENCLIFIDHIQNIISSGLTKGGSLDTSALIKPALIKGEIQVVGATTYDEYQNHIEKDLSLARCFQKINISEPDNLSCEKILLSIVSFLEQYHSVTFSEKAIKNSIELIRRYIKDGSLPDKAIDVLDRAAAIVSIQVKENKRLESMVSEGDILEAISGISGIPLAKIKGQGRESLARLEEMLKRRVIGQDEVIQKVSEIVRSSMLGFKLHPQRPNAILLFIGPTGVGKTELAKSLADVLFGDEEKILRIDMSEYMERISSTRLIGSSPGYVGYSDQNQLTDKIRQNPYTVILLDEMEKADAQMINLFLQVFDAGRLTDGRGRTVNFNSSIIIMTSNIGTELYFRQSVGYGEGKRMEVSVTKNELMKEIRKRFSPEFINRIDEIVFFNALTQENVKQIALLQLRAVKEKLLAEGKELVLTDAALDLLSRLGYSPEFGARNLVRVIRERILDTMALLSLDKDWQRANHVIVDRDGTDLTIRLQG